MTAASPPHNVSMLYRTTFTVVRYHELDLHGTASTYRRWLVTTLGRTIESQYVAFAATAPAPVVTLVLDPLDSAGAELFWCFRMDEPLPRSGAGGHGPVVVIACIEPYARRVLHGVCPAAEQAMTRPPGPARSWVVVAAAGGVSVFEVSISEQAGRHNILGDMVFDAQPAKVTP